MSTLIDLVRRRPRPAILAVLAALCSCSGDAPAPTSPGTDDRPAGLPDAANWSLHRSLVAAREADYAAADGGGSARLIDATPVRAAECGRFVIEYTAGPLGVAIGGKLHFQVSPFWEWSTPQTAQEGAPGYTRVMCSSPRARLRPEVAGHGLLVLHVADAPLLQGEIVTIVYGEGGTARVDRYADDQETFHLWVDGDGDADGTRKLVDHTMRVVVAPHDASELLVVAPSSAAIDESFEVVVAALDAGANAATTFSGSAALHADAAVECETEVVFRAADRGARRVRVRIREAGVFFLLASIGEVTVRSNPIVVRERPRRMLWADLQIHSSLSDGTGSPEELYRYARDVAGLDVAAVTDHDHHGMHKLDETPAMWTRLQLAASEANASGGFVALLGYEWTSWIWGHRHVLYFGDTGQVWSSITPLTDTPQGLWQALAGQDCITVPHHPGGGAQALDWSIPPDPRLEPAVEIVSVHGSSEVLGGQPGLHSPKAGHFVRDALARGYRLGFLGSTDGHDGHPGLAHYNAPSGGITALLTDDRTRAGVRDAIRARRTYATSGERIYVEFSLGGNGMGSLVKAPVAGDAPLAYRAFVIGTAPLASIDVFKNNELLAHHDGRGEQQAAFVVEDPARAAGDFVYLRVEQQDGHAAWTSPIYTE